MKGTAEDTGQPCGSQNPGDRNRCRRVAAGILRARELRQLPVRDGDEPAEDLLALGLVRRLDHHPDQRLGARGAHQDAAAALELGALALDRLPEAGRLGERLASRRLDVLEQLRQLLDRAALRSGLRSPSARIDQQRRGDAVAGRREVGPDDVAGLLAAERPAARDAAPRSRSGRRPWSSRPRSRPPPSPCGSRSCSSRSPPRRRGSSPASREVKRRDRDDLVAVELAARRRRRRARGRRRRRRRSRSRRRARRPRSASVLGMGRAAALVDVAAVGLGGDRHRARRRGARRRAGAAR